MLTSSKQDSDVNHLSVFSPIPLPLTPQGGRRETLSLAEFFVGTSKQIRAFCVVSLGQGLKWSVRGMSNRFRAQHPREAAHAGSR